LTSAGTTLRLPIGYWDLGRDFCVGTPFEEYADVYLNAWSSIKALCHRASLRGIGILMDFHALPGGANRDTHSGTNSGVAALWGNASNLDKASACLQFIAREAQYLENVIGIEVCNEAMTNAPGMYDWYDAVIKSLSAINPKMPLYISDGWDLRAAIDYSTQKNSVSDKWSVCPVVIDTHKYYCFGPPQSPQDITSLIPHELDALNTKEGALTTNGAVQVVIGEYSCVLSDSSWGLKGNADRASLVKAFGNAQSNLWQARAGGSFFWTYKMVRFSDPSILAYRDRTGFRAANGVLQTVPILVPSMHQPT
jgi:aryl-phospho-beta-D-glucosidase BglC (GH1 family)